MKLRRFAVAAVALALLVPATGCKAVRSAFTPKPTVVTQEATVAAGTASVSGELPEGTPEGLPVWPGAVVESGSNDESGIFSLVTSMNDAYSDVVSGVSVGFERAGWTVTKSAEEASATVLDVSDKKYEGIVTVYRSEDSTSGASVEYLLTKKQ